MNWKFNAWTVLFAFTLLASFSLFFVNSCTPTENTETEGNEIDTNTSETVKRLSLLNANCNPSDSLDNTIPDTQFVQDTMNYGKYLRNEYTKTVANPDVIYFSMKPCELYDMALTMTWNSVVTAHMAIKEIIEDGDTSNQIVIHFRGEEWEGNNAENASSGGMLNYDFTAPCPTLCPGS